MAIQIGDPIPDVTFTVMAPDGPQLRTTDQIFKGHKAYGTFITKAAHGFWRLNLSK